MFAEEVLKVILQNVETVAKAKTIIGDPIELGGKTVVPICKVSVGFGAGGSEAKNEKNNNIGGGGGGGFTVEPIAFLVINDKEVNLLPVKPDKIGNFAKTIPLTVEKIGEMAEKAMAAKQKKNKE
ncbi:sporulation protein [bacterium]|nr:sporulation protein [bacterium]